MNEGAKFEQMTDDEKVAFFFAPPLPMQSGQAKSTLHLARREIQDCLFGEVFDEATALDSEKRHRLFASAMVIFATVDLLGRMLAGQMEPSSQKRFEAFARRFMLQGPKAAEHARVLYIGGRSPLMHSFAFHNETYKISFIQGYSRKTCVGKVVGAEQYVINLEGLYDSLRLGIERYQLAVRSQQDVRRNLLDVVGKYGKIDTFSAVLEPVRSGPNMRTGDRREGTE